MNFFQRLNDHKGFVVGLFNCHKNELTPILPGSVKLPVLVLHKDFL